MTKTWRKLSEAQRAAAEQAFDAMMTTDALMGVDKAFEARAEEPEAKRRFGFADLHAFVTRRESAKDAAIQAELARDGGLRATFRRLLSNLSMAAMSPVAAASSGALESRECEGFRIDLKPSKADAAQVYVTIRQTSPGLIPPDTLFIIKDAPGQVKFPLPDALDGDIQLVAEETSDLVKGVRDKNSEIYLA